MKKGFLLYLACAYLISSNTSAQYKAPPQDEGPVRIDFPALIAAYPVKPLVVKSATELAPDTKPIQEKYTHNATIYQLLFAQKFADLDAMLSKAQARYEADPKDNDILEMMSAFNGLSLGHTIELNAYAAAFPNSYVAQAAHGIVWVETAWAVRGSAWTRDTPAWKMSRMEEYAKIAIPSLEKAATLSSRPTTALLALEGAYAPLGHDAKVAGVLQRIEKLDPSNRGLWSRRFKNARPQWGGGYEKMREVAREAEKAGLRDWVKWAESEILAHRLRLKHDWNPTNAQRLEEALKALEVHRGNDTLWAVVHAYHTLGKYAESLPYSEEWIKRSPDNSAALNFQATTLEKLRRPLEAQEFLFKAARIANYRAVQNITYGYFSGHLGFQPNREKMLEWCIFGASIGLDESLRCIAEHSEVGVGTNRDPQQVLGWLLRAAYIGHTKARFEAGMMFLQGAEQSQIERPGLRLYSGLRKPATHLRWRR